MRDIEDKEEVALDQVVERVVEALDEMQVRLLEKARAFNEANIYTNIDTLEELEAHIESKRAEGEYPGWVLAGWDGTEETEALIKERTGFTTRNIPFEGMVEPKSTCIVTGKPAKITVWLARAY